MTGTAPMGIEHLDAIAAPFGSSSTLPAEAYTSPELFSWELTNLFARSWQCVGRATMLREPGDVLAVRAGDEQILLTRTRDGAHAFYNVCRHRGHELLSCGDSDHLRVLKCPYHSWVYDLDGSLRRAPRFTDHRDFDADEHGLLSVPCRQWCGWLFVDASAEAPPFDEYVGGLADLLAPYQTDRLVRLRRHEYIVAANWKLIAENFHECYHCPTIHPELCRVSPPDSGHDIQGRGAWIAGDMDLRESAETMSLDGASKGVRFPTLDDEGLRRVLYIHLLPNLLITAHPDYVLTHRLEPLGPGRTRVACNWLFPPEALDVDGFAPGYAVEFWDLTNRQDWEACEGVQRSTSSRGFRPGPLAPDEAYVYRFLRVLAASYRAGRLVPREGPERPLRDPGSWLPDQAV
jgi:glycine betaine catabolism A